MDPINEIVRHISTARYEDLPPQAAEAAKKVIVDIMGAALAGSSSEPGKIVARMARAYGGKKSCTIAVYGDRVPAPLAALANGVMARCRELDDHHEGGGGHLGVSIVPAVFAIAERARHPVSGRDVIAAVVLGTDLLARLRLAAGKAKNIGWMAETLSPLCIAAVGARLLKMDERQMRNAIGIAYSLCSGNVQPSMDGTYSLWLPAGSGAAAGIMALDLAREGFTGVSTPFSREAGLYRLYFGGEYDEKALLGDLGKRYETTNISIKPYPCCGYSHHAIYTTLRLMEEHNIRQEEIAGVTVATSSWAAARVGFDEQGKLKSIPRTISEARFSMPYAVGAAMVKGNVSLGDFTDEAIVDRRVLAAAAKVQIKIDPRKEALQKETLTIPVDVSLKTVEGKVYSGCESFVKGDPRNPLSMAECVDRFMQLASFSERPVSRDNLLAFVRTVETIENVAAANRMMPYLAAER